MRKSPSVRWFGDRTNAAWSRLRKKQRGNGNEDAAGFRNDLLFNAGVPSKLQKSQADSLGRAQKADDLQARWSG
jgi:hypothetical protein